MKKTSRVVTNFLGMDTKSDPAQLWDNDNAARAQLISGFHVGRNGSLDSANTGTGAGIRTWSGYPIKEFTWDCQDGHTYHLAYTMTAAGVCEVEYLVDAAVSSPATLTTWTNDDCYD